MKIHRRWRRVHGHLFWRIYLNGLLLVALVAVSLAAAGWLFGRGTPVPGERYAELAALQVQRHLDDPARLAADLAQARELGVELTIFQGDRCVASNVEPPPPPLPPLERRRLAGGPYRLPGHHHAFAAPAGSAPDTYVILQGTFGPAWLRRALVLLGVILVAVALAAVPLARAIASPLERLTAAARRLGGGDLGARAGFAGRGEVGELARAFDEMAERMERLIRSERDLLANVSHELRTPLARIRVALDLAAEGDLDRARRFLGEIGADLSDLERLVEDVLTAARLEHGGGGALPLHRERIEAGELLARAAERFRGAHPERTLELQATEPLPALDADPALLRRVLDNLLDNARKYSAATDPVVLAAHGEGEAEGGAESLVVDVRDRGVGIAAADLPHLFTPFFRGDRSRTRGTGGVGLGLALARRIVEAHGGSIALESTEGQGTTVRVRLPAG